MKRIQFITRLILVSLLLVKSLTLYGQNHIDFYYKCGDGIKESINSRITLKQPNNKTIVLYSDTVSYYDFSSKNFFKNKGKYQLIVLFDTENYGKDTVNYKFELNGTELSTTIYVSFNHWVKLDSKGNKIEENGKRIDANIGINKSYLAPKSVEISYDQSIKPDVMYDEPFFKIRNNSRDTIYGTRLPGYFWGKLDYLKKDSVFITREGTIDELFADSPPLYPDSSKIATVGSFGYKAFRKPEFKDCRFVVWYKTHWSPRGKNTLLKQEKELYWWAETTENYKLTCDFKIDNQTPNR